MVLEEIERHYVAGHLLVALAVSGDHRVGDGLGRQRPSLNFDGLGGVGEVVDPEHQGPRLRAVDGELQRPQQGPPRSDRSSTYMASSSSESPLYTTEDSIERPVTSTARSTSFVGPEYFRGRIVRKNISTPKAVVIVEVCGLER